MSHGFLERAQAARHRFTDRGKTEIRTLHQLHAKVILIDGIIAFCGSANWYRHGLEEAAEIVLRGDGQEVPTLLDELSSLWDQAATEDVQDSAPSASVSTANSGGYKEEVVDPIAAAKIAEVPGAFVLRRKPPQRPLK
jgi:phosphatidylserine/phosphatidylglycerophosphate/cardiolipin synthase-like enzyme